MCAIVDADGAKQFARACVEAAMDPYRSDLAAAQARIASLEAALHRVERDRAQVDASRRTTEPRKPWSALALVLVSGALLIGFLSPSEPAPAAPPLRNTQAAEPPPSPPSPSPIGSMIGGPLVSPPVLTGRAIGGGLADLGAVGGIAAVPPEDSAFVGQYWEARVTRTGADGPPVGTECLISIAPGAYNGAGIATVRCGGTLLHRVTVRPPSEPEDRGFCWFSGRDLYCAPPGPATQVCWINTAGHAATCDRDIDLTIHSNMRDPRERPPPDLL